MRLPIFKKRCGTYFSVFSALIFLQTIFAINPVQALSFSTAVRVHKCYCDTINGSARIIPDPIGTYTYRWSNGNLSDSSFGLAPGNYYVTVTHFDSTTGARIDSLVDTIAMTYVSVRVLITSYNRPTCGVNNGNIYTAATGGSGSYTFHYYKLGVDLHFGTSLNAGIYTMSVEDNVTGCRSDSASITLTDTGLYVTLVDSFKISERCYHDSTGAIRVSLAGGRPPYHYRWSTGDTISAISHLSFGAFSLSVTDSLCPSSAHVYHFYLKGPTSPLHDSLLLLADTCLRGLGAAKVLSSGGTFPYSYHWSSSSSTADTCAHLLAGNYSISISDANACQDTLYFGIANAGGPSAHVISLDSACAFGPLGAAKIKVTSLDGPHQFRWSQDSSLNKPSANGLSPGLYTVTISNNKACDTILHITIPAFYSSGLILERDSSILLGQEVGLNVLTSTLYDSIYWFPANKLAYIKLQATVKPTSDAVYHALVFYTNGCRLEDSVKIQVRDVPPAYVIPNIFTPNADGVNDAFYVNFNEGVKEIELHIFDRWGNKVFDSFFKDFRWDGTLQNRGLALDDGVYTYFLLIKAYDTDKLMTESGSITLLR